MRHVTIRTLHAYWNRLRGERTAPARTEIEPRAIAAELGDVFLLEGPESDFRFRLAGSRMTNALGRVLTGARYDTLWEPESRANAERALHATASNVTPFLIGIRAFEEKADQNTMQTQRPAWANLRRLTAYGQPDRRNEVTPAGEMILLPLRHGGRDGGRILGAFALFDPPVTPVKAARQIAITSTRALGREAQPIAGTRLLSGPEARSVIRRHGHLVVMRGFRDDPDLGTDISGQPG